jgi:penicillin-binding protein 1A
MTSPSPQPPKTNFTQIATQFVQNIQVKLKPKATVAQLKIKNDENKPPQFHQLIGDHYTLGRSSQSNIKIENDLVGRLHCSVTRHPHNPRLFLLKDENSKNGVFVGKRRQKTVMLYHGDFVTLGPPELANCVEVKFLNPPPWWILFIRYSLYGISGLTGILLILITIAWSKISVNELPRPTSGGVVVYARDGQTTLRKTSNKIPREMKSLKEFSPHLPLAVIASEDSRYYWHFGVDPIGIVRAITVNLRGGQEGASTITQQLARSIFKEVGRDNSINRKLREIIVATKLETFYSKDELLLTYLNRVYLGINLTGFEDAAQFYFQKSAKDLDIAESATLVAVLPAPNEFNPVKDYDTALALRNRIIQRMKDQGMISEEEAQTARRSRIEVSAQAREAFSNILAPHFYAYVFQELKQVLGAELAGEGNFIIETTIDLALQAKAEQSLDKGLINYGSRGNFSQGAIVTLDTQTGGILAMTGGIESEFNRATQAQRQPGSTFKVFAYAAALERGISPFKAYSCNGLTWQGQQYRACERSSGNIDMYRGLAQSENVIALRIAQDVGLKNTINMAQKMGIKSPLKENPGLILGESEVNVLEITGAYATFANGGIWNRPHGIAVIRDSSNCEDFNNYKTCHVIYDFTQTAQREGYGNQKVMSLTTANNMTQLMRGVIQNGTGKNAYVGVGEVGKTGTTNKGVDLWFIGYIPNRNMVTGIWLGNDDNSPTNNSSSQAASLWGDYMKTVVR